jgi:hypothetical protein
MTRIHRTSRAQTNYRRWVLAALPSPPTPGLVVVVRSRPTLRSAAEGAAATWTCVLSPRGGSSSTSRTTSTLSLGLSFVLCSMFWSKLICVFRRQVCWRQGEGGAQEEGDPTCQGVESCHLIAQPQASTKARSSCPPRQGVQGEWRWSVHQQQAHRRGKKKNCGRQGWGMTCSPFVQFCQSAMSPFASCSQFHANLSPSLSSSHIEPSFPLCNFRARSGAMGVAAVHRDFLLILSTLNLALV